MSHKLIVTVSLEGSKRVEILMCFTWQKQRSTPQDFNCFLHYNSFFYNQIVSMKILFLFFNVRNLWFGSDSTKLISASENSTRLTGTLPDHIYLRK